MRKKREIITPDLTPVIDIVFILLIFFMVTSVFKKEDVVIDLNLPDLHSKAISQEKKPVIIELTKGELAIEKKIYFMDTISGVLKKYNKDTKIEIRIDKDVEYSRVMELFDALQLHNLTSFSLVAQKAQ
jgi:biopolymer transport protein ExbD